MPNRVSPWDCEAGSGATKFGIRRRRTGPYALPNTLPESPTMNQPVIPSTTALRTRVLRMAACGLLATAALAGVQAQPLPAREQLNAVLWQQRATEYRGLALQTWRQAAARLAGIRNNGQTASLEQRRAGGFRNKPAAVVLDIDETVLDNTPFNALLLREGRGFDSRDWDLWVAGARAAAVPGAAAFVQRARSLGFRVVFVTNRECNRAGSYDAQGRSLDCPQKASTLNNLASVLGARPAAADLLMRDEQQTRDDSDKQARRAEIARTHRIALLAGDDLNDFIRAADYRAEEHAVFWGATSSAPWVALPNAIYGSWDRAFPAVDQKYAALDVWQMPPQPPTARLAVVSWNLAWLADPALLDSAGFWTQCAAQGFPPDTKLRDDLPFCDVYKRDGITTPQDYAAKKLAPMRQRLAELAALGMDVLAVQETGSPGALQAVLPPGYAVPCFTTRIDAQNLGFAVRQAANLSVQCREVRSLSQEDNPAITRPVRRGIELVVTWPGAPTRTLALLNVHLKAACPAGRMDGGNFNCITLRAQTPALEAWVEEQANAGRPFAVIGDWNRDLEAEFAGGFSARSDGTDPTGPLDVAKLRNLWPEVNDGKPAASLMDLTAMDRSAAGVAPPDAPLDVAELLAAASRRTSAAELADAAAKCHAILDQMVVSQLLRNQLTRGSLAGGRVPATMLTRPPGASDHCPVRMELMYR